MENKILTPTPDGSISALQHVRSLLRGAGQVMFQDNALTGLFFLIGIFWGSYESGQILVAWGAIVGLLVSTMVGYFSGMPCDDGRQGLWGFNGILVGCAFPTFLGSTVYMWLALILCAALTTWCRQAFNNILRPLKVNSLTFPFVVMTWIFMLAARQMRGLPPDGLATPELSSGYHAIFLSTDFAYQHFHLSTWVAAWLKNIAQIFLIDSWITGIFFLIGLAVANRWAALWAAVASFVALLVSLLWHAPEAAMHNGLYGFSAVLTGIALGCIFYRPGILSAIWAIIGIITTVFVQAAMDALFLPLGLPTFTAPFCLTTWLFLIPLFKLDEKEPNHSIWHSHHPKVENDTPQNL